MLGGDRMSTLSTARQEHNRLVGVGKEIHHDAPQLFINGDVEGDGWAGHGSMLSLGAIAPEGETFYIEMAPLDTVWDEGQRRFCEEHGLKRERLVREGIAPTDAIKEFAEWILMLSDVYKKPAVLSAFNAGYDHGFIQQYSMKADIPNPFGAAPYDIKSRSLGITGEWDWRLTSKGRLPEIILPEGEFTHNALEDSTYQQPMDFALTALEMEAQRWRK